MSHRKVLIYEIHNFEDCSIMSNNTYTENLNFSRDGKWTGEEEKYAEKLIQMFTIGQLPNEDVDVKNESLRRYLSRKLHCQPMRLTKKFGGRYSLSARYHQAAATLCPSYDEDRHLLNCLEREFHLKDYAVQANRVKRRKYSHRYYVPKHARCEESFNDESYDMHSFQINQDASHSNNILTTGELGFNLPLNWEVDKLIDNSIDLIDFPMNLEP
mmetsp:Transcript_39571/g.40326  ORF Transcript_39571/g.40326 Transcript_39571/m.40326 type:complete len:214 (+) Transcript_39571:101-742(+)